MTFNRRLVSWFFTVLVLSTVTSCNPGYRMDVEQGNIVTLEQRTKLQLGMSRRETRFILGSPLVKDPFHANRWDYVYSLLDGATGAVAQQRLSLFFEDDLLVEIRPGSGDIMTKQLNSKASAETARRGPLQRLWNWLQFAD
jgi:outer membrane protein assembly factor BamE